MGCSKAGGGGTSRLPALAASVLALVLAAVAAVYVKTSGKEPYLEQAHAVSLGWGEEAANSLGCVTFVLDSANRQQVGRALGAARAILLNGTGAHTPAGASKQGKKATYAAQRRRTRAVFVDFCRSKVRSNAEWLCFVDDDNLINVPNLRAELRRTQNTVGCSPNCWIGDRQVYPTGNTSYTTGGWCMERALAHRIHGLLRQKTDEELRWLSTDDVGFSRMVRDHLHVTPADSMRWFSQHSKPVVHLLDSGAANIAGKITIREPGYGKHRIPTWQSSPLTMGMLLGHVSVYHSRLNLRPGADNTGHGRHPLPSHMPIPKGRRTFACA